jgi:hypothetical protein
MVAGGLNPNGTVNPVSNPPGAAANWYLTAPGWGILVPDYGPAGPVPGFQTCGLGVNHDLCQIQGTSYASPHVTGAVALVMDAFPGLTPLEVVNLLLTTTDDTGAPGTDSVNGRGRLNVGRAFQPIGPLAVPLAAGASPVTAQAPLGVAGAAFGDGLSRQTEAWSMVGFDQFRRAFPVQLAGNWLSAGAGPSPIAEAPKLWRSSATGEGVRMQMAFADDIAPDSLRSPLARADLEQSATRIDASLASGLTVSFAAHGANTIYREGDAVGHLDSINADMSLRLTRQLNDNVSLSFIAQEGVGSGSLLSEPSRRTATAARASLSLGGQGADLTFGSVREESGVLGLTWASGLGETPPGETRFAGVDLHFRPMADWRVNVGGEYGVADLAGAGWLTVQAPLRTSAFSLQVIHPYTPDWFAPFGAEGEGAFTLSLSQPLRVEDGLLSFMAPTATRYGLRSLRYEERQFSPTPSGRELRLGLGYTFSAGNALSAFGEALYVTEPGHVQSAAPESMLRMGVRVAR